MVFLCLALSAVILASSVLSLLPGPTSIRRVKSGRVVAAPLTSGSATGWDFNGDVIGQVSPSNKGGYYSNSFGPGGLAIGVKAVLDGKWSGYYYRSPWQGAKVFHVRISIWNRTIPSQYFDAAMWVQTSDPRINTVSCGALVNSTSHYWFVEYTKGDFQHVTQFVPAYVQSGGPLARDCTIVTNGSNLLMAYFDGKLVYSNESLNLNVSSPFQTYLEVQSTYGKSILNAGFSNYFSMAGRDVTVLGATPGDRVTLLSTNGTTVATSPVGESGRASFDVLGRSLPINGTLRLENPNSTKVVSLVRPGLFWGGDVYTAGSVPPATASLTVRSTTQSGSPVSGFWVALWDSNGTLAGTGFTTTTFTGLHVGDIYRVSVQDYGNSSFMGWEGGSTGRTRTVNMSGDMTIVAYYSSPPSVRNTGPYLSLLILILVGGIIAAVLVKVFEEPRRNPRGEHGRASRPKRP